MKYNLYQKQMEKLMDKFLYSRWERLIRYIKNIWGKLINIINKDK